MVGALLDHDPQFAKILKEPLPAEPEESRDAQAVRRFREEFDRSLEGKTSKLIDWKTRGEKALADAVREALGVPGDALSDDEAVGRALDPGRNPLFGETLNLTTLDPVARALVHPSYTFRKKISHAADSQNQRHRMTPGSRSTLRAQFSDEPDYIAPALIDEDEAIRRQCDEAMEMAWEAVGKLRSLGVEEEYALYLLPNAAAVRFTESADLLNLHHKHRMRLCYNAQEEIWRASLEEALQIRDVHPRIGAWLLPPCAHRRAAGAKPICPEGARYCGVGVWKLAPDDYERLI
jgi:hypothetical protein